MRLQITSSSQPPSQSVTMPDSRHQVQTQPERRLLGCILGLSLAIQLLVAPYQGYIFNLASYLGWGTAFVVHPLTVYSLTGANYPPLTIYIFAVVELLYQVIGHLLGFSSAQLAFPLPNTFAALWLVAKLPIIAANVGSSWLIYRLARLATSARWALLAALAYAIAPSMVLDGAIWGQTDGMPIFFILLAIVAIQSRRSVWAGVLLGLAVMIKPQPVIFVPILLLYILLTLGRRQFVKASLAVLITILVICSPFLLPPHIEMLDFYHNVVSHFSLVTEYAFNLWFLIAPTLNSQTPVIGSLTANSIGVILFAPIYTLALVLVWHRRSLAAVYMALALAAVGFFDLTTLQRERYLFQALAFLLLAAVYYRSFVIHYAIASITVFTNIFVQYSLGEAVIAKNPRFMPLFLFLTQQHPQIIIMTAYLNLELLVGVMVSCIAWMRASSREAATGHTTPQMGMLAATSPQKDP